MKTLERMAKAHLGHILESTPEEVARLEPDDEAINAMRAAIATMAEPTPAMIQAFKAERLKAVIAEVGPEYPALHFIGDAEAESLLRSMLAVVVQAALEEHQP